MNYAIPGQPQYQDIRVNPWAQQVQGYTDYMQMALNESPRTALEEFLRIINPSQTAQATIRAIAPMMQGRWDMQNLEQGQAGAFQPTNWADYLRDFDYDREFARMAPSQRREEPQRFTGRARTITY